MNFSPETYSLVQNALPSYQRRAEEGLRKLDNFNVETDNLTATDYQNLKDELKFLLPGMNKKLLDSEIHKNQSRPGIPENPIFKELYWLNTDQFNYLKGAIAKVSSIRSKSRIAELNTIMDEYLREANLLLPVRDKLEQLKGRVAKRVSTTVSPEQRYQQIKERISENLRVIIDDIAEDFRTTIQSDLESYYTFLVEDYLKQVTEKQITDPDKLYGRYSNKPMYLRSFLDNENYTSVYTIKKNWKEIVVAKSERESHLSIQKFIYKMYDKLGGLLADVKGNVQVERTGRTKTDNSIRFIFSDGAEFTLKNSIVASHSKYGLPFYRYPTTFHNIKDASGKYINNPSEYTLKSIFNINANTLLEMTVVDKNKKVLKEGTSRLEQYMDDSKYPRPPRMKKPQVDRKYYQRYWGIGTKPGQVYVQDEFNDILRDKYGNARGEKNFDYIIGGNTNSMYPIAEEIMSEKAKMLNDLGEKVPPEYFDVSYFLIWQAWMKNQEAIKSGQPLQTKEQGATPVIGEAKTLKLAKRFITETYNRMSVYEQTAVNIILSNDKERVTNQLRIVEKLKECIKNPKEKTFIKECIQTLKGKLIKMPLQEAAIKTLELREAVTRLIEVAEAGETEVKIPDNDYKYLRGIRVKCLEDVEAPATLFITFSIDFYPAGSTYSELRNSLEALNRKFTKMGRNILNQTIHWKERKDYFNGTGIWEGSVRLHDVKPGDKVRGVGELVLDTTVDQNQRTFYQYLPGVNEVLRDVDSLIPQWFPEVEPETAEVPITEPEAEIQPSMSDEEINQMAIKNAEKEPELSDLENFSDEL